VEKLVYGGDGLARVDGRVVLMPLALPGERIVAQVENEKPGLVRARAVEVLQPAPERVPAPCPYFGRCGGCHYQHAPYEYQLQAKRAILAEELRRLGKIEPPEHIAVVSAEPWGYRNRAQLRVENGRLGYLVARSHNLCAIDHCPIASPRLNEVIGALNGMLRDRRWTSAKRS
jgi:23S rRNA (uracil1939-C5)-methyltransferase